METMYIPLIRGKWDTIEDEKNHLAWFGRWWLSVTRDWLQVVRQDAKLEERLPFIPKLLLHFEEEDLQTRHLDEAIDCVLVEEDEPDTDSMHRDRVFQECRYGRTLWW